ncbi:hypothetical protein Plhal703r1_c10g0053231 [Plasmopara halstedii]
MRFCCELVILLITCVATLPKASFAELNRPYSRCLGTANSHRLRSELFTNQVANSVKKPSLMRKFFDYITGGLLSSTTSNPSFLKRRQSRPKGSVPSFISFNHEIHSSSKPKLKSSKKIKPDAKQVQLELMLTLQNQNAVTFHNTGLPISYLVSPSRLVNFELKKN